MREIAGIICIDRTEDYCKECERKYAEWLEAEYVEPAVVTVEVVRCKDCARRNKSADSTHTVLCTYLHNLTMPKNGFCNYGEREK